VRVATTKQRWGWALQGMALWHALLFIPVLGLLAVFVAAALSAEGNDGDGLAIIAGFVLASGALIAAAVLGGLSWALLGREFLSPRWSLIVVPGLVGTIAVAPASFIGWPTSEAVGAFVAFWLVSRRVKSGQPNA